MLLPRESFSYKKNIFLYAGGEFYGDGFMSLTNCYEMNFNLSFKSFYELKEPFHASYLSDVDVDCPFLKVT